MRLPSLEEPAPGTTCDYCGELIHVDGYCDPCAERIAAEKRREDANEYRRQTQIALELEAVRRRTRRHVESKSLEDLTPAEIKEEKAIRRWEEDYQDGRD